MTTNLRAAFVLDLLGNLPRQARSHAQAMQRFGRTTEYSLERASRRVQSFNRATGKLFNRYTATAATAGLALAIKDVANFNDQFIDLQIQTRRTAEQLKDLKQTIFDVATDPNIKLLPERLLEGIFQIQEQTGDLRFAQDNTRNLGTLIRGANVDPAQAGLIIAGLRKIGISTADEIQHAISLMQASGDAGSLTLQNMASEGKELLGTLARIRGEGVSSLADMLATLQVVNENTGSASETTTTYAAMVRDLVAQQKKLRRMGVEIFADEDQTKLREFRELIPQIVAAANSLPKLSSLFTEESIKGFGSFLSPAALERQRELYRLKIQGDEIERNAALASTKASAAISYRIAQLKEVSNLYLSGVLEKAITFANSDAAPVAAAGAVGVAGTAAAAGQVLQLVLLKKIALKGSSVDPMYVRGLPGTDIGGGNKPRGNHRDPYGTGGDRMLKHGRWAGLLTTGLYGLGALGAMGFLGYVLNQGMTGPQLNGMSQDTLNRLGDQSASDGALRELRGSEARLRRLEESIERVRANESPRSERLLEQLLQARAQLLVTVEDDRVRARVVSVQGMNADVATGRMDTQP